MRPGGKSNGESPFFVTPNLSFEGRVRNVASRLCKVMLKRSALSRSCTRTGVANPWTRRRRVGCSASRLHKVMLKRRAFSRSCTRTGVADARTRRIVTRRRRGGCMPSRLCKGHDKAQCNLALMHADGLGGPKDEAEARTVGAFERRQ